ncbi:MAG: LysM peptidoglycan-binding domain-containing protein [Terracoccus sp.]
MPLPAEVAALTPPAHVLFAPTADPAWRSMTVRGGDTLWHIAIANRTTTSALVTKNRLPGNGSLIHIGQTLLVPTGATPAPVGTAPKPAAKPTATKPAAKPTAKPAATKPAVPPVVTTGATVYVVRAGDTMSGIAARYKVSLSRLVAANTLSNPAYIRIGQTIIVPGVGSTTSKPATTKPATSKPAPTKPTPTSSTPVPGWTYPAKTLATAAASKAALAAIPVPNRTDTAALIRATALRHGVDPKLALAIGWQESGWNQRAVSYTNAIGVMQIMPISGTWGSQLAGRTLNLYKVEDNITAGVLILRSLQKSAESREQAIGAYYQGLYSIRSRGMYTDTKAYVTSVLAIYDRM